MNLIQRTLTSSSLEDSTKIGKSIGQRLRGSEVIELNSDLGGGKTVLVKGIVLGAGSNDLVSSPSFTICNQYQAPDFIIYHFDFYRLSDPGIISQELAESLSQKDAVVIIEWPGVVDNILPTNKLGISLEAISISSRKIILSYNQELAYLVEGL